jgi:hypothetical protein
MREVTRVLMSITNHDLDDDDANFRVTIHDRGESFCVSPHSRRHSHYKRGPFELKETGTEEARSCLVEMRKCEERLCGTWYCLLVIAVHVGRGGRATMDVLPA